jgi:hypothetical protein
MKKIVTLSLLAASSLTLTLAGGGCARPGEFGWTPAYSAHERGQLIARNWDYEGKQSQDDLDHALLLRPASGLTIWDVR